MTRDTRAIEPCGGRGFVGEVRAAAAGVPGEVVAIRGLFGDAVLRDALDAGVRQVVGFSGTRLPAHPPGLFRLDVSLRGDWAPAAVARGLDPSRPVHWIAEGLFYYLAPYEREAVIESITRLSAPGSSLAFDILHDRFLLDPERQEFLAAMKAMGTPYLGSIGDPWAWLSPYGWVTEAYLHADLVAGRCPWLPDLPVRLRAPIQDVWFVRGRLA